MQVKVPSPFPERNALPMDIKQKGLSKLPRRLKSMRMSTKGNPSINRRCYFFTYPT